MNTKMVTRMHTNLHSMNPTSIHTHTRQSLERKTNEHTLSGTTNNFKI